MPFVWCYSVLRSNGQSSATTLATSTPSASIDIRKALWFLMCAGRGADMKKARRSEPQVRAQSKPRFHCVVFTALFVFGIVKSPKVTKSNLEN
jgi:hypothetical protein